MPHKYSELSDRYLEFSTQAIAVINKLPRTIVGRHVATQLMKSATSPGANYEEACGAESRADFIHKMGIVLKELKETRYWLRLIHRTSLVERPLVEDVMKETEELCSITAKSILTAKAKPK